MSLGKLIEAAQSAMVTPGWEIEFWSPVLLASIITIILYVCRSEPQAMHPTRERTDKRTPLWKKKKVLLSVEDLEIELMFAAEF